jgi:hypothetical protein
MSLESKVKGVRKVGGKVARAGKAVASIAPSVKYVPFEEHFEQATRYKGVEDILDQYSGEDRKYLEGRLRYHLEGTRHENRRLRYSGGITDIVDSALVPVDVVADAGKIIGGIGYGISAAKELAEMPFKLFNSIYYAKKTGDYKSLIKDGLYEVASFLVPGSLLDLTKRYSKRVDKYVAKEAARRFVKEVKDKQKGEASNIVRITEEFDQEVAQAA